MGRLSWQSNQFTHLNTQQHVLGVARKQKIAKIRWVCSILKSYQQNTLTIQEIYRFKLNQNIKFQLIFKKIIFTINQKSSMDAYIRTFQKSIFKKIKKNMKQIILMALFCLCILSSQLLNLPAPKHLLFKAVETLKAMKRQITACENSITHRLLRMHWSACSKQRLYQAVLNSDKALNNIEQHLNKQGVNNLIRGKNNRIAGDRNIVIGSENTLSGEDNWIIQKKQYNGTVQNFLIYQSWAIDMNKISEILINPWNVIKRIQKDTIRRCRSDFDISNILNGLFPMIRV